MYHNTYPASWLLGNHVQHKSPVVMSYGDLSLIAVDTVPTFVPYGQLSQVYASPVFDVPNMKRIPVSLLMHNMDSLNCFVPMWCRRDFNRTVPERQYSKDSLLDSGNGSDGTASSSRSSTPSSVGVSPNAGRKMSRNEEEKSPVKPQRQKSSQFNIRHSSTAAKPSIPSHQKHNLHYVLRGDQWDRVSQEVWKHYVRCRQPEEMYFKKMQLRNSVHNVLIQAFPNCNLCVVGSSVNGLGTNTSDMDMCLILTATEIDQQTEAMLLLRCVQRILNQCSFIKCTELITAKVPILKFTDDMSIQVDLNINNTVGIANTNLIRSYCCLDWRVQPLVLIIKKWAQDYNINNAKDMTLSSYSLTLMVIHYLQCGSAPAVLPCLQKVRPDSHDELPNFKSWNNESLGKLLIGFFNYFGNIFDFERDVMSVRLGCKLPKHVAMNYRSTKNKRGHWKYICIEEPFNRTNTACAVYDAESFGRILTAFRTTYMKLKSTQDISAVLKL